MSVYVDDLMSCMKNYKWRYDKACHLIADDIDELHLFASKIGMKKSWFQKGSALSVPHYDLTPNKRTQAIKAGAIPLEAREFVKKMRKIRSGYIKA